MLNRIVIENFQSHKKTELELGKFTVLVGHSSSGKTSVLRALEALATNPRGASVYVSSWAKRFTVTAVTSEGSVAFSVGSSGASYKVTTDEERDYTKLNNVVPVEVEAVIGLRKEDVPLLFPGQFSGPYLLTDTGSSVAREFGSLTNIDKVYAAAREGNRLKASKSTQLKLRQADLKSKRDQAEDVSALEAALTTCDELEQKIKALTGLETKIRVLGDLLKQIKTTEDTILAHVQTALPTVTKLEKSCNKMIEFKSLLQEMAKAEKDLTEKETRLAQAAQELSAADVSFHERMNELGYCPLCNGDVND